MHQQGRMSEETIRFLVGSISDNLKSKFSIDSKGLWFNKRLEEEATKRNKFTESRRENGSLGGRPKAKGKPTKKLKVKHMDNHMEDVNDNENDNENNNSKESFDEKFINAFDDNTCSGYKLAFRNIDLGHELQKFRVKCDNDQASYYGRDVGGLRNAFQYQLQNIRTNGKRTTKDNKQQIADILNREFGEGD